MRGISTFYSEWEAHTMRVFLVANLNVFLFLVLDFFFHHRECDILFVLKSIEWLLHKHSNTHTLESLLRIRLHCSFKKRKGTKRRRRISFQLTFLLLDHILILYLAFTMMTQSFAISNFTLSSTKIYRRYHRRKKT